MSTTVLHPRVQGKSPSGSTMAAIVAGVALVFAVGYGLNEAEVSSGEETAVQTANIVEQERWTRLAEQAQIERAEAAAIADFQALQHIGPRTSEYFGNYSDLVNGKPALTFGTLRTDAIWSNQADPQYGSPVAGSESQVPAEPKSSLFPQ